LSGERVATLTADVISSPAYNKVPDPTLDERLKRVKAKLMGYVAPYDQTLRAYPDTDQSIYGHYARAYAWHKAGYPDRADAEANALVKADPNDPYFLEIKGQILLEAGKPAEALAPLRAATEKSRNAPLIATTFGHALIATENKANYPEAITVLRSAVARDDDNPFAWYQLGTVYELTGDEPRAMLATAETASLNGDVRTAAYAARNAMAGLPPNSRDWIRAQDIAMTSQNEMDDNPDKYKRRR
jgi:predicted Zn-dependent protease